MLSGACDIFFFFQAEDGIRDLVRSRGLGDVYKRQGEVPYLFQDIVLLNRNVQAAKVMTATKAFADFTEADIAAQTFAPAQTAIGADWRSEGGPGAAPAVRTDRYYITKDGTNNYYKIRFTSLTQNGERGYPSFELVLIKKG